MSWNRLPIEVAEDILLHLPYHKSWPDGKLYDNAQNHNLLQCAHVSRHFHAVLTPLIYRDVHFNDLQTIRGG